MRRPVRAALAVLLSLLLCIACNFLAFAVDTPRMRENAAQGAAMLGEQYGAPQMVGGFLSGGLDLVLAGSVLIKNSVGMCGILLLLLVIAVPLIQLVVYNLFLKLTAAVTEPIGAEGISGVLSSLSGAVNYFIAGLLAVGFMYFVTILLLICSSNVLF